MDSRRRRRLRRELDRLRVKQEAVGEKPLKGEKGDKGDKGDKVA